MREIEIFSGGRSLSPEPSCWDLQQLVVHRYRDGDRFYLNLLVGICRG
ncbi:hypothetical protein [uncultured Nostoc sp.]